MKRILANMLVLSASAAVAQTGIPWTPVNLTGAPVAVAVVDSYGNLSASFIVSTGQSRTLWVPVPTGGGIQFSGQLVTLDGSGTNANYLVFSGGTNGTVMTLIENAPPVSTDAWPLVNWEWFWAGFGLFASFFGFTWALRFTKQIGRVNPEP